MNCGPPCPVSQDETGTRIPVACGRVGVDPILRFRHVWYRLRASHRSRADTSAPSAPRGSRRCRRRGGARSRGSPGCPPRPRCRAGMQEAVTAAFLQGNGTPRRDGASRTAVRPPPIHATEDACWQCINDVSGVNPSSRLGRELCGCCRKGLWPAREWIVRTVVRPVSVDRDQGSASSCLSPLRPRRRCGASRHAPDPGCPRCCVDGAAHRPDT